MAQILDYKCPCCGGTIQFDSSIQKMKCPFCDTEFDMETLKEFENESLGGDKDPDWDKDNVEISNEMTDAEGLNSYICESCGGEIIADDTMAASSCPYCGNSVIIKKQLDGMLKPDYVLPFKLDKKAAEAKMKEYLKGKILLPNSFKTENRIKEIKGVYVPFWLYDCDADADITCRTTTVRTWRRGDTEYTETSHFLVSRSGNIGFNMVPVDGSEKMDDALMNSIEPFDYKDLVPFETAYLSGYLADKYDQSAEVCAEVANDRMKESTRREFMNTIHGYATCVPEHTNIDLKQGKITYALLPVWVLNSKYKGEIYTFAMNGQSGKFIGNLPMDKGKAFRISAGVFAAASLLTFLITAFL